MPSVVIYRNGPGAGDSFTTIAEIRYRCAQLLFNCSPYQNLPLNFIQMNMFISVMVRKVSLKNQAMLEFNKLPPVESVLTYQYVHEREIKIVLT